MGLYGLVLQLGVNEANAKELGVNKYLAPEHWQNWGLADLVSLVVLGYRYITQ